MTGDAAAEHLGMIEADPAVAGADPELAAIEAGAQDFEPAGQALSLRCKS